MKINQISRSFSATLDELPDIQSFINESSVSLNLGDSTSYDILLAVTELVTNTILYGYKNIIGPVEISIVLNGRFVQVEISDRAPIFDPNSAPTPDLTLPLEQRSMGGLGIYLVKQTIDQVIHQERPGGGNLTTLIIENNNH